MCRASALDAPAQFLNKPGNVLLTNCGMSTADRIYPLKTDPHRKPDVTSIKCFITTFNTQNQKIASKQQTGQRFQSSTLYARGGCAVNG